MVLYLLLTAGENAENKEGMVYVITILILSFP